MYRIASTPYAIGDRFLADPSTALADGMEIAFVSNGGLVVNGRGSERVHVTIGIFEFVFDTTLLERETAWEPACRGKIAAPSGLYLRARSEPIVELSPDRATYEFCAYTRVDEPASTGPDGIAEKHYVVLWHEPGAVH